MAEAPSATGGGSPSGPVATNSSGGAKDPILVPSDEPVPAPTGAPTQSSTATAAAPTTAAVMPASAADAAPPSSENALILKPHPGPAPDPGATMAVKWKHNCQLNSYAEAICARCIRKYAHFGLPGFQPCCFPTDRSTFKKHVNGTTGPAYWKCVHCCNSSGPCLEVRWLFL